MTTGIRRPQVCVLGSAEPGSRAYDLAGDAGQLLARLEITVVSGCGSPATRIAAQRAQAAGGFVSRHVLLSVPAEPFIDHRRSSAPACGARCLARRRLEVATNPTRKPIMSSSRMVQYKESRVSRAWRRWAGSTLLALLLILTPPLAQAGLLGRLLHPQGDSGSGKVARLAFRLDDASFVPTTVVWSPDGRFIATSGTQTTTIHIWDVAQRKLVKVLELPHMPAPVFHNMAWSPDGRYLATCNSFATSLRLYATKDWSVAKDFGWKDAIGCAKAAFSSDSRELTVWGGDLTTFATSDWHVIRQLKGVQINDGKVVHIPHPWNQYLLMYDMAYVPGTHTLVFGAGEFTKGTGTCLHLPPVPYARVAGLVFVVKHGDTALPPPFVAYCMPRGREVDNLAVNPDGKTLTTVTGMTDGIAGPATENYTRVLRLADGKDVTPALNWRSDDATRGLAYTPDGRFLIMGETGVVHTDHAVYIIDAHTMQLLDTVHAPPDVLDLAVAPDSSGFAVATGTGVTVWTFVQRGGAQSKGSAMVNLVRAPTPSTSH